MQTEHDARPAPLTPADCDLREFQFMPLDVLRLRDSDIAVMVTGEEFRSAVMLWCAAWHQVPAGSLPNDDRSLANLAGLGRAVVEWMKVKEGALRGWVECSDGRLYHAVVCEKARDSWDSKLQHAYDKLADRLRKLNKKREESGLSSIACPPFDEWKSMGRPLESDLIPTESGIASAGKSQNSVGKVGGIPLEKALKGEGQGEYKRTPHTPRGGKAESEDKVGKSKRSAIGLPAYLQACREAGTKSVPEGDPVFAYAAQAGIPLEFLRLHWLEFKARYSDPGAKRYKDWPNVHRKSVRGNWFKLWFIAPNGDVVLTTVGEQARRVHGEAA